MKIRFSVAPPSANAGPAGLPAFVDAVRDSGFDGIWLSDLPTLPALDPLLGLALAAGRTTRLRLGVNLVPLGRNPYLLAKQLAQLDQLSSGRLLLSLVSGLGSSAERQVLGLNGANRGAALEQMLGMMRTWWAGGHVDHQSERWSFADLAPAARPLQDPLEIWLGGRGPQALDRVGRTADGWLGAHVTPAEARSARARIQGCAARADREIDPEHFGLSIAYSAGPPEPGALQAIAARRSDIDPRALVPVGERGLRSVIERYIDAGLSKFVVRPLAAVAAWADETAWLADAILDLQT